MKEVIIMTDNAKKFLAFASKDEALKKELTGAKNVDTVLELAKANGFELKAEDFNSEAMEEISEDEMQAVAGGRTNEVTSSCSCNNVGSGLTWELACSCNKSGNGYNTTNGGWRCGCGYFGLGLA